MDNGLSRVALVVFANDVQLSMDFTSDVDELNSTISNYSRFAGSTNIVAGLRKAAELLRNSNTVEIAVKNLVVLMTDGANNNQLDRFEDSIQELKGVKIKFLSLQFTRVSWKQNSFKIVSVAKTLIKISYFLNHILY